MAVLQLLGQRLIVKYLYENHGSPYFQMRVPEDLYERFGGRKKISIALREEDGPPSIQVIHKKLGEVPFSILTLLLFAQM